MYCMAQKSPARAELRMAKICDAKRRHSKDRLGIAKHRRAKASQGIAWQCLARALRSEAKRGEGIAKPRKA